MADYNFQEIEKKWQDYWKENQTFKVTNDSAKPKFYVLDMFPYPSGAGLHVGHPLGYIASDIVSRYKNNKGFNVLHPMGFDAFGLPAEQYAIQTGQHPAVTTAKNLERYKEQLTQIGFSFDWSREVQTCDPKYYKWTQWIFMQLFQHYYDNSTDKAEPIEKLVAEFEQNGNSKVNAVCDEDTETFTAAEWNGFLEKEQSDILLKYRLTFLAEATVNWCPALGTVLANDEVKDGVSERGGHPVERKKMKQWMMRITAYAERLLNGLDNIDWPEPMKEMQRNWIGKSYGAEVTFNVEDKNIPLKVFTTRPDTLYGVTYMSIAPEHELVEELTTDEQRSAVESYVEEAKNRSERDRMSDTKTVSGVFTGSYAIHPITGAKVPIWIADYVLAGYGTGIVMAVPSSDTRDYAFATHFDLPIIQVQEGPKTDITQEDFDPKAGTMVNSDFLNGLSVPGAITKINDYLEENGLGKARVNFRMRDAVFSRQRYWGEPVPVYFKNDIPYLLDESELPLVLPSVDAYLPTEQGDPPLGRAKDWTPKDGDHYELSTMPGWAGSSWYFLRYMDPDNDERLVSEAAEQYWNQVDLYIGGSEHATGHLLYSRFWNKFLKDIGYVSSEEPFKKLVNQGMIQGMSSFAYRVNGTKKFVSVGLKKDYDTTPVHVDIAFINKNNELDIDGFKGWRDDLNDAEFVLEDGKYICGQEVEKMSKSKYNVVNPDDIIADYGADTLRMYEMFLGPLETAKPWDTKGIDGVFRFLRKFWALSHDGNGNFAVSNDPASEDALKVLHKTIKKVEEDINRLSFNTAVSAFMICVNELSSLKCNNREVIEQLTVTLSPFAPHICEELWALLGHKESILKAPFPKWEEKYVVENAHEYPISINGKMRTKIKFPIDMGKDEIEKQVLADEAIQKWLEGKTPKKVIVVPKKIVNLVV